MINYIVIGILILIALFDYALLVACSHMEDREQYQYERWRKEQTMICIDAENLRDGLYNIKDGKIYKYKAKGGTVRAYELRDIVTCGECKWLDSGKNDSEVWSMCTRHFGKYFDVDADDFCSYGEREGE